MRATFPHSSPHSSPHSNRFTRLPAVFMMVSVLTGCQLQAGPELASMGLTDASAPRDGGHAAVPVAAAPLASVSLPRPTITAQPAPPPSPADLWAQLRESFVLDHSLSQKRVRQELRWMERHPEYLPRLESRLQRYMPYIYAEVERRGLPGELALLPIVESALDPYAFSHGGAAGLWQFIPGTASHFGLPRNWWVDGRRDPVLATAAALDYLEHLYGRFDDWNLAVAGYNAGEGNVKRALRRADGKRAFWDLHLPRETSAYVPRLLALAALVANPQAYGVELPALSLEPAFVTIETRGQFDLMKAAGALNMELDALYEWNPALNQWATPPEGPHHLHVPASLAQTAQQRLDAVPERERVQWLRIEVVEGATLGHIARRHRTDVATLRRVNGLASSRIRAGQALLIPKSSEAMSAYPVAAHQPQGDYQVKPGDSLWSIARAHEVPLARLIKANRIGPKEVLRVGQRLSVPGAAAQPSSPSVSRGDVIRKVHYGVRSGDSLARIASKFNVAVRDLAKWNQLDISRYLQPGQNLLIYVNVAAAE